MVEYVSALDLKEGDTIAKIEKCAKLVESIKTKSDAKLREI